MSLPILRIAQTNVCATLEYNFVRLVGSPPIELIVGTTSIAIEHYFGERITQDVSVVAVQKIGEVALIVGLRYVQKYGPIGSCTVLAL